MQLLGEYADFEAAVLHVIHDVKFDNDVVVSVFETNIRVVGGLLGELGGIGQGLRKYGVCAIGAWFNSHSFQAVTLWQKCYKTTRT